MEQVTTISLAQQTLDPNASARLEQYRQRLVELLRESESNAWDIGDLLNQIEKSGVVRSQGYAKTRTWLDAKVPEAQDKTSTLYRYAKVAGQYSREQVRNWKISRLEYLMIHDQEVLGHLVPEDPANREVELVRADGSKVMKRFCDCSSKELRASNQRRKQAKGESKATVVEAAPDTETPDTYSPLQALAMVGTGVVITPLAQLLPSPVSLWIALIGFGLFFTGLAMLIRHWRATWNRFLSAVNEGKGIAFLHGTLANIRQGAHKLAASIRSGVNKDPPARSEESPPPREKKAA